MSFERIHPGAPEPHPSPLATHPRSALPEPRGIDVEHYIRLGRREQSRAMRRAFAALGRLIRRGLDRLVTDVADAARRPPSTGRCGAH